jgi:hypothetical protein
MAETLEWRFEQRSSSLLIHFDVQDHFIKLDTFISTAESVRNVIEALDETFFGNFLRYEIIVLAPEEGSFRSRLLLLLSGGAGVVFMFLESDIGAAYVKGLTGKDPAEWAQMWGQDHQKIAQDFYADISNENKLNTDYIDDDSIDLGLVESPDIATKNEQCAQVIVSMTQGVLEKSNEELDSLGMNVGELPQALNARADFYMACINNSEVKGVGFGPGDEKEPPDWFVSIENLSVTSPNWDKEDQKNRHWKARDQLRRDCLFIIEDEYFWSLVHKKALRVDVVDSMRVQWVFQVIEGRTRNRRVLRVIEFNGDHIADALPPEAINAIIGDYNASDPMQGHPGLFD